jgi:hypothetical protein
MNEVETAINLMHSQHDNPGANEMSQSMVRLLSLWTAVRRSCSSCGLRREMRIIAVLVKV